MRLQFLASLLATWFGSGKLRPAPGTWGTAAALPVAVLIDAFLGWYGLAVATLLVSIVGIWAASAHSTTLGIHDASEIVIDEVAGVWLCLLFVDLSLVVVILGFVLFRVFDILKPWPIRWLDKTIKGGLGVMLDDLAAGLAAGAALWVILHYVVPNAG